MDLLSRLIAGSAATSPTKQKLNTPAERLAVSKRLCGALQQTWRNDTRLSNNDSASSLVANHLTRLNTILQDESRKAAPHSCLIYVASAQVYIIIAKLALSSDNPDVINGARRFFHLLINGEAEGILDSKIFARSLVDLVRRSTQTPTVVVDEQGEADLVELLFEIATKIRLDPDILPAWFYPERDRSRSRLQGAEARRSQFPLFYVLVEYVHHDPPTGDFARTGLLYLTDLASKSKSLENWMIESDLAPQMASGLCALYSRLSRQTRVWNHEEKTLPIVALSDSSLKAFQLDETPEEFQANVKAFLLYLAFWQDTLNHCKSEEVKDTLLDYFQVLFVQQLLYPSLLESSDVAGGSTSAVMLHSYRMLEALDHPEMARGMLRYLFAATKSKPDETQPGHQRGRLSISRRKSMERLASLAETTKNPSPDLFDLLDLLTMSLRSKHAHTVNASLKLVTVIVRRHHHHVLTKVFRLRPLADTEAVQKVADFTKVIHKLFDLAGGIAHTESADESYQAALNDGQILLQRHSCMLSSHQMLARQEFPIHRQAIAADCKLFEAIITLSRSFFTNDALTNVILTESLVALATCEHVVLREWLTGGSSGRMVDSELNLIAVLEELVDQLKQWKLKFTEWDMLFSYQRTRLAVNENVLDGSNMRSQSPATSHSSTGRANSPQSKQRPATPVRTSTTRGRAGPPTNFASIDGTLAQSPKLTPTSPNVKVLAGSPLHQTSFPRDGIENASATSMSSAPSYASLGQLQQQVDLPNNSIDEAVSSSTSQPAGRFKLDDTGSGFSTPRLSDLGSGHVTPNEDAVRTTATLSHIMTNAVILQEFIFEIAALLQLRTTLFDEVDLT